MLTLNNKQKKKIEETKVAIENILSELKNELQNSIGKNQNSNLTLEHSKIIKNFEDQMLQLWCQRLII